MAAVVASPPAVALRYELIVTWLLEFLTDAAMMLTEEGRKAERSLFSTTMPPPAAVAVAP